MKARNVIRFTAVMLGAVVTGLLAVQVTWAVWNSYAPSDAQSVRAADFQVHLNGNPTIVKGAAVTVALGDAGTLVPGGAVHAAVNVTVPTNASAPFTVAATVGAPQVTNPSVAQLRDHLRISVAVAPASGRCAEVTTWAPAASARITKGGAAGFCIRIQLLPGAPETVRGATAGISVPVTVNQE